MSHYPSIYSLTIHTPYSLTISIYLIDPTYLILSITLYAIILHIAIIIHSI